MNYLSLLRENSSFPFSLKNPLNNFKLVSEASTGLCSSSFGELLQGKLPNGREYLVTLPVQLYSYANFYPDKTRSEFEVIPKEYSKVQKFLTNFARMHKFETFGTLILDSEIPKGKGLSSSTADIVAAYQSVRKFTQRETTLTDFEKVLREIEPSDGIMYSGSVVYAHRECRLIKKLGTFRQCDLVMADEGGVIDTVAFNHTRRSFDDAEAEVYANLLDIISNAFQSMDLKTMGRVATISTIMQQKRNRKRNLNFALKTSEKFGCLGLVNTHSGTCLGFLVNPDLDNSGDIFSYLLSSKRFVSLKSLKTTDVI